jgi:hypothetical protein
VLEFGSTTVRVSVDFLRHKSTFLISAPATISPPP